MTKDGSTGDAPGCEALDALEALAAEFARLSGAEIMAALGGAVAVSYKGAAGSADDPVSEVDRHVETLLRARIAEAHPDHLVVGEEFGAPQGPGDGIVWAVDPVDGTMNFVNGLPLFSASIGVLYGAVPVAGAVWCSASHRLGPGVYSARRGGPLHFEGRAMERLSNPAVRRRLVGLPRTKEVVAGFDARTIGSSAVECAFVAAGLLAGARFTAPSVWDVAGGIALVEASGGVVRVEDEDGAWRPLARFAAAGCDVGDIAAWRGGVVVGEEDAASALAGAA